MTAGQIPNPNQNSTTAHLYDGKTVRAAAPSRKKAAGSMQLGTEIPKDAIPEVQIGYESATIDNAAVGQAEDTDGWMVGLGWKDLFIEGNRAGLAIGQRMTATGIKGGGAEFPLVVVLTLPTLNTASPPSDPAILK